MSGVSAFKGNEIACEEKQNTEVNKRTKVSKRKQNERERIVIDLNLDALKLMDELKARTGAVTRAELLRNMLKYSAATIDELDAGYIPLWMGKDEKIYRSMIHKILIFR